MVTSYSRELMLGIPQGTLIDIETTGLDMDHDEIVLFGYIEGSHLEIICRSSKEEAPFIVQLADLHYGLLVLIPKITQCTVIRTVHTRQPYQTNMIVTG